MSAPQKIKINNMNVIEKNNGELSLRFDPRLSTIDQLVYMKAHHINTLEINFVFKENNKFIDVDVRKEFFKISTYKDFDFVTSLYVIERSFDIEGISIFKNLTTLTLNDEGAQEINFGDFRLLKQLNFCWRKKTKNLNLCSELEEFGIRKYNKEDLTEFTAMKKMLDFFLPLRMKHSDCLAFL